METLASYDRPQASERVGKNYAYRLREKGARVCAAFVLFHKRICGPLPNSLFHHPPRRSVPNQPSKSKPPTTRLMPRFKKLVDLVAA